MHTKQPFFSIYHDKRWLTVSNALTVSRIVLAPCVVMAIYCHLWTLAFWLFFFAGASDFFDGYIARIFKDQTYLGKMLDPIADKLFLSTSFGALAFLPSPLFPIPEWFFVIVLAREAILLVGVYVVMRRSPGFVIDPTIWGKLTTCVQLLFIMWLFVCYFAHWSPIRTYKASLLLLTLLSIASLLHYGYKGIMSYKLSNRTY